jgi:hypothetical protein
VANSQDSEASRDPDLLAAVVLHTLVTEGGSGMTVACVAIACERDPENPAEMHEIEAALQVLLEDELARREDGRNGRLYAPTRAAVRASELSF